MAPALCRGLGQGEEGCMELAIAGTGLGIVGLIVVIILIIVLIRVL